MKADSFESAFFLFMLYLLLSILFSLGIFTVFRIAGIRGVASLPFVSVNYFVALVLGVIVYVQGNTVFVPLSNMLLLTTFVIGIFFILMFMLIHRSTNTSGVAITSSAAKLSVVFPVILSFFIDTNDILYSKKLIGILILLGAFLFIIFRKDDSKLALRKISLPILLFLGMGLVDSLIKFAQQFLIPDTSTSLFMLMAFVVAATSGLVAVSLKGQVKLLLKKEVLLYGSVLGLFNYGALFFLVEALNLNINKNTFFDSSRIFMINNLGIILLSTAVGMLFFSERLKPINIFGILLSVIGFYLII